MGESFRGNKRMTSPNGLCWNGFEWEQNKTAGKSLFFFATLLMLLRSNFMMLLFGVCIKTPQERYRTPITDWKGHDVQLPIRLSVKCRINLNNHCNSNEHIQIYNAVKFWVVMSSITNIDWHFYFYFFIFLVHRMTHRLLTYNMSLAVGNSDNKTCSQFYCKTHWIMWISNLLCIQWISNAV